MTELGRPPDLADPTTHETALSVVCVDDDPGYLDLIDARLADDGRVDLVTVSDPDATLDHVEGADCVVCDYQMPTMDGLAVLDAVREREPGLPFVLLTGHPDSQVAEQVLARPWTDYLEKTAVATTADLLSRRVEMLVEHRRAAGLARRALAAAATVRDAVAVADPDGTFAFADRSFERRFGYDHGGLLGEPWRSVFTDVEVDRIEGGRLPALEEGWRWSGECEARHADGTTFQVSTTVTGLDDGSLVFVVPPDGE